MISGFVQGVGYRFFFKSEAEKLGVKGWVRNLMDSRVEAVVQGLPEKLEELRRVLQRGPARAQVKVIEAQFVDYTKDMEGFKIKEDGAEPCLIRPRRK